MKYLFYDVKQEKPISLIYNLGIIRTEYFFNVLISFHISSWQILFDRGCKVNCLFRINTIYAKGEKQPVEKCSDNENKWIGFWYGYFIYNVRLWKYTEKESVEENDKIYVQLMHE